MKRDMELVGKILLRVQEQKNLTAQYIKIPGYEPAIVGRHAQMLLEGGFLSGWQVKSNPPEEYPVVYASDLSWSGHDFVAIYQNKTVWKQIKSRLTVEQFTSLSLTAFSELGMELIKAGAKHALGIN